LHHLALMHLDRSFSARLPSAYQRLDGMPRTRPLILVSAFSLIALFIVLLVVELAPIVAVATTDGLWFMAVPEEFTATLWSPLRPLLWGSYFYHYFGFLYYTAIRPAHWLTEWLLGSREVTIAYTQVYGTIIKVAFSAATIALAAGVLASRTLPPRAKAAILLFMLALLIANADFYWVYHARVTYALSVKLFATGLLIITLVCAERAVECRAAGGGVTAAVGAIGGVLFFENLLYFALVIYPTLLIAATTPARLIPARAFLGTSVGTASALVVLVAFYAGDGDSIIAAVSAHFAGLASGHPTTQPGYYEHFVSLFLDRRSAYFACHVILVAGALVALTTLIACLICVLRHRSDRTTVVLGLLLAGHFAIVGAYVWPFLKHPTYATVFAATIESLFFITVITVVTWGALRLVWSRRLAIATGGIAATAAGIVLSHNVGALNAPSRPQTWGASLSGHLTGFAAAGAVVRQFDEVLNDLVDRYAIVDNSAFYPNDHVLYWQFRASELFSNTISGLIDNRYNGSVRRERHPHYRFWQSQNIADVANRCYAKSPARAPEPLGSNNWYCARLPFVFGTRYANYYDTARLLPTGEAWVEPLPADVAAPLLAKRLAAQTVIAYPQVRGRARKIILDSYPALGLHGEPLGASSAVRWSILPLRTDDLRVLGSLETNRLIGGNYVPFLASVIGARVTYLLLWLPTS
jgi:hypothetical protein